MTLIEAFPLKSPKTGESGKPTITFDLSAAIGISPFELLPRNSYQKKEALEQQKTTHQNRTFLMN